MKAVDTNVLLRILVDDDEQMAQVQAARQFAKNAKRVFVPQIVQIELVWVLMAAYDLEKNDIIPILHHLQSNEAFFLQQEDGFSDALHLYQSNNIDFSDCLILVESEKEDCNVVVTFDKKFSRLLKVSLLS